MMIINCKIFEFFKFKAKSGRILWHNEQKFKKNAKKFEISNQIKQKKAIITLNLF